MRKNLEISVRVKNIPRHATTMALSASGTKRDKTKKDTKRTFRKHQKIIDKERMNKLPRDIILMIAKMHPLREKRPPADSDASVQAWRPTD